MMRQRWISWMERRQWATCVWSVAALCLVMAVFASLLAGCAGGAITGDAPLLPVLRLPPQLAGYHVYVSDVSTGDVAELGIFTTHVSKSVHGLGLSADGKTLYVTDVYGNNLDAFASNTLRSVAHSVPVGVYPVHMVNTLDGRTLFVTNYEATSISVIDTTTWKHVKDISVPAKPHGIVLSPDGRYVYAACSGAHAIAVIDVQSETLVTTIQTPALSDPFGMAISADGHYVYASDNITDRLLVIDARSNTYLGAVRIGDRPALIARSPDGKRLYVANGASHNVSILDISSDPAHPTVIATVQVEGYPHGLAVTPDGRYVVTANTLSHNLSLIDTTTNQNVATIAAEEYPNDVLITA